MLGGSRQETLDVGFVLFDTREQSLPISLKELTIPSGFDPVSLSFISTLLSYRSFVTQINILY
ncbi:unnamed protein product [Schistosoma margrebowiei]|uniref:Uncharacterized protein n=1 Tax=Schistosoma margrebowiei TaxID=48269 RepID=A0A183LNF4_9TREM|nr:unnamed protein product [Schistosoma margrebowiei]